MITPSLTPISRPIKTHEFIALDTEGTGTLDDFKLAATFDNSGARVFYDRDDLKGWLFTREHCGKLIVAANLEYDYAVAFQPFDDRYEITLSNRKWLRAVVRDNNKHAWTAIDIQRIAPLSVKQMGKVIGLPKLDTPPSLVSDRRYKSDEWYCETHGKLWCVECYCIRDTEITYKFAVMYQAALNELGATMKYTAASCAMDLFRRKYLHDEIPATLPERNDLARTAYYGGRVEVFTAGTSYNVNVYDFNSLYPSIMKSVEVGIPSSYRRVDAPSNPYSYLDNFGLLRGTIRLPENDIGMLPHRSGVKLYFPYGKISGGWMLSELRNAVENGAIIETCDSITFATETRLLFADYVNDLYAVRLKYQADGRPDEVTVKLLLTSLYGKFAQNNDTGLQTLITPTGDYDLEDYANDEPVVIAGREAFLRTAINNIQPPHVNVAWAAEITSQARLRLLGGLLTIDGTLIYSDTDSIHTTGKTDTSNRLGELKLEHEFPRATYYAPKEYGGIDKDGTPVLRAKGIPPAHRDEYLTKGAVEFQQPIHILSAIRRGKRIAEWVNITKHRRSGASNRKHEPITDYNTTSCHTYPYNGGDLGGVDE